MIAALLLLCFRVLLVATVLLIVALLAKWYWAEDHFGASGSVPVQDNAEGIMNRCRACQSTNGLSSVRRKETHTGSALPAPTFTFTSHDEEQRVRRAILSKILTKL